MLPWTTTCPCLTKRCFAASSEEPDTGNRQRHRLDVAGPSQGSHSSPCVPHSSPAGQGDRTSFTPAVGHGFGVSSHKSHAGLAVVIQSVAVRTENGQSPQGKPACACPFSGGGCVQRVTVRNGYARVRPFCKKPPVSPGPAVEFSLPKTRAADRALFTFCHRRRCDQTQRLCMAVRAALPTRARLPGRHPASIASSHRSPRPLAPALEPHLDVPVHQPISAGAPAWLPRCRAGLDRA